jgi:REP element-mobilizing transposase RayT
MGAAPWVPPVFWHAGCCPFSPMSRPLRHMPSPWSVFEVTCRTLQARFLLKPSSELNALILGIIGRALSLYNVRIYLFVVVSNHMHFLLSASDVSELSRFMNHVNSNIAREAGRLYSWHEKFWGRRFSAIPVLDDESLLARVRYILSHGCKEGLVSSPSDWPGINCVQNLTLGKPLSGFWHSRTKEFASKKRGDDDESEFLVPYEIPLEPLPPWTDTTEKERQNRWKELISGIEAETKERLNNENKSVLGKSSILAQHPYDSPNSPKKSPRPFCHTVKKFLEKEYREGYRTFIDLYRQAFESLRTGKLTSLEQFPPDCYIPPFAYQRFAVAPG